MSKKLHQFACIEWGFVEEKFNFTLHNRNPRSITPVSISVMLSHPVACQNQWRRLCVALRQQQKTMPHPCPNPALQNASHM